MKIAIKILIPLILICLALYFIGWIYPVSSGKRSGKLVKTTNKGKIIKTCEGTLDQGSGDKLTWEFSVKDDKVCDDLINNSGEFVDLSYEETFFGFPRDTKYKITKMDLAAISMNNNNLLDIKGFKKGSNSNYENKDAFCSLLGSIYSDQKLYQNVKKLVKEKNLYLYKKIETCNN